MAKSRINLDDFRSIPLRGKSPREEGAKQINVFLSAEAKWKLSVWCAKNNASVGGVVTGLVDLFLKESDGDKS